MDTALAPVFYGRLLPSALWYPGSGMAIVFVSFLNVAFSKDAGRGR